MVRPELQNLLKKNNSVFSLVVAVAKRSRDISEKAQEDRTGLPDKPVNLAVEELIDGKIRVVEE